MLYHHLPHSCRSLPACEEKSSRGQGVGVALISVTSLLRNHTSPQRAQHLVPLHSQPYTCPSLSLPMGTLLKPPSRSFECEHPSFCQMHSLMQLAQPWCLRLCLFQNQSPSCIALFLLQTCLIKTVGLEGRDLVSLYVSKVRDQHTQVLHWLVQDYLSEGPTQSQFYLQGPSLSFPGERAKQPGNWIL